MERVLSTRHSALVAEACAEVSVQFGLEGAEADGFMKRYGELLNAEVFGMNGSGNVALTEAGLSIGAASYKDVPYVHGKHLKVHDFM